jgi:ferritin
MGVFDKGVDPAEFEKFKREVKVQLDLLMQEIKLKASDSEDTARAAADRALELEKKIKAVDVEVVSAINALAGYVSEAKSSLEEIKTVNVTFDENEKLVASILKDSEGVAAQIVELKQAAATACEEITADFTVLKSALVEAAKLPDQVEAVKKLLESSTVANTDIDSLLSHALKKKSEIDELHRKINGSDIKSSDGTVEHVDGLIDVLSVAYTEVEAKVASLDEDVQNLVASISNKHADQLAQDKEKFEGLVLESSEKYAAVNDQLMGLLPGAMAAGLSAAYENKKHEEIKSLEKYELAFKVAIGLMVVVSLIPFGVDAYQLIGQGAGLVQVIQNTPSLMLAILPLYFPVLWLAYSSSKKLNLSKRLIEEYTHKAVLGGTFSGLSNQIESLPRESLVRDELRTRLLFNLLQVSSENPGKLITDYNKSDHPLMDALENSAKLSGSIETLSKLPGFSAIAKKLAARTDEILSNEARKVVDGIAAQDQLEKPDEKSKPVVVPTTVA